MEHCSTPYVKEGDYLLFYNKAGGATRLKLAFVKNCRYPHDVFFAEDEMINKKSNWLYKLFK